jgi:tape measure domain-containing protein
MQEEKSKNRRWTNMARISTTMELIDETSVTLKTISSNLADVAGMLAEVDQKVKGTGDTMRNSGGMGENLKSGFFGAVVGGNLLAQVIERIAVGIMEAITKTLMLGDSFMQTYARIKLIAGEGETVATVNEKIYNSAMRARASYEDTAKSITKLGLMAGDAFSNTDEIIKFSELLNKVFTVGGTAGVEKTSALYQLTQAMGSGKLQGDEFRSIMENAPMLAAAIAKFMGKSKGELKQLGAEGKITADVIKGALFAIGPDVEKMFSEMPITYGEAMTRLSDTIKYVFGDTFTEVSSSAAGFITFLNDNMYTIAEVAFYAALAVASIGTAALIYSVPGLLKMAWAAVVAAGSMAMAHAPLLITAAIIMGLLLLMLKFPEVAGMIVGSANVIKDAFFNAIKLIADYFIFLFNMIITGVNKIRALNGASQFELIARPEYKNLGESYTEGYAAGKALMVSASNKINAIGDKLKNIGSLGTINAPEVKIPTTETVPVNVKGGKLDKHDVSLAEESLRVLKDIALKEIQLNYKQVTPNIHLHNTIVKEADAEAIIAKIEERVVELYESDLEVAEQ